MTLRAGRIAVSDNATILATAVEQSDYPLLVTTAKLDSPGPEIVYVNEAVTRMTGDSREELGGATPHIHEGLATERSELHRLKDDLRAGDSFEGCTWEYRSNKNL